MLIDQAKFQSAAGKAPQVNLSSHPEIQEYHHTLLIESQPTESDPDKQSLDDGSDHADTESARKATSFLELTIRNEGFKATPYSLDDIIHF